MASVRVDPLHHMVSFASKIEPSPDWIVGVTGLELCLRNCTWLESKTINLYPWDVGTDAGPTYTVGNTYYSCIFYIKFFCLFSHRINRKCLRM